MSNWVDIYQPPLFLTTPGSYNSSASVTALPGQIGDQVGDVRWQIDTTTGTLRALRFVQLNSGSAGLNNTVATGGGADVCYWANNAHTTVDSRASNSVGTFNATAGCALGTIAPGNYDWILCKGPTTLSLVAGGNPAIGAAIIGSTTDKLVSYVASGTAPTFKPFGWALAAANGAGSLVATYMDCL